MNSFRTVSSIVYEQHVKQWIKNECLPCDGAVRFKAQTQINTHNLCDGKSISKTVSATAIILTSNICRALRDEKKNTKKIESNCQGTIYRFHLHVYIEYGKLDSLSTTTTTMTTISVAIKILCELSMRMESSILILSKLSVKCCKNICTSIFWEKTIDWRGTQTIWMDTKRANGENKKK